jgi:hypothetical protein
MHMRIVPSFFFTNTTEDANGLELGLMWPMSNNSLIAFSISSLYFLGCLYGVVITGLAPSSNSMMCSNPLSGGFPGGMGSKTLLYQLFFVCHGSIVDAPPYPTELILNILLHKPRLPS